MKRVTLSFLVLLVLMASTYLWAEPTVEDNADQEFHLWLKVFSQQAREQGVSEKTINSAFDQLVYDRRVIAMDQKQPEFTQSFANYLSKRITALQVRRGKQRLLKYRSLFNRIAKQYKVEPALIAAIWGVESNFGTYMPTFNTVQTLATLAFDPRRSDYFKGELLAALQILDQGRLKAGSMKGSYSGAMGQPQFMPSSYLKFAQDFDQDGFADIWQSNADVLASIAKYLKKQGRWQYGQPWGVRVSLPSGFDVEALVGQQMDIDAWLNKGLMIEPERDVMKKRLGKTHGLDKRALATLLLLERSEGEAFLVMPNFKAVMEYNRSHFYALAVCLLADKLSQ